MAVEVSLTATDGQAIKASVKALQYLFVAFFDDGTCLRQTPEDRSTLEPDKRSQFYDVLQKPEKLTSFWLCPPGQGAECMCGVNLEDGRFTVYGKEFLMHQEPLRDFKVIFFRQHTHAFNTEFVEKAHEVVYQIGWKARNQRGEEVQRVMEIS